MNGAWYNPDYSSLCSKAANLSVGLSFSLGSDPKERRINLIKALMNDFGLKAEQAAGVVGNFMHESGGKQLPPDVNEGGEAGPPKFSGGYGWAQWTGGRQTAFIDFAIDKGYMQSKSEHATDAANYAYLKDELSKGYKATVTELQKEGEKQGSPEEAAVSFEATFERAGVPALEPRKTNARQAYEEYRSDSSTGETSNVTGCTGPDSAAIVGGYAFPLQTRKSAISNNGIFKDGTTSLGGHPYTAYDILVDTGTPVLAFVDGTVTHVGTDKCPGTLVSIYNKESDLTVSYLHMSPSNHVQKGDEVKAGDRVGEVGTKENGCNIPHLHIDAAKGSYRPACRRESCPAANRSKFKSIGRELFNTYQQLPE